MDNRPLKFDEFWNLINQTIFVSATPADFELQQTEEIVVEQLIRPTGLLDPPIEVRPSLNQIDDILNEINKVIAKNERALITTLTKRMAEELDKYFRNLNVNCRYIHSDVETIERVKIMQDLRTGVIDVLIGVNLLREGLDLPEVSFIAILDADKEGFLRSERSLTQTAGRAARNINSKVIMYADKITYSMKNTILESLRRREIQTAYNQKFNITPTQIVKSNHPILGQTGATNNQGVAQKPYIENELINVAADPVIKYMSANQLKKIILKTKSAMENAVKKLDFIEAARLRDELYDLQKMLL
jgi:excinuclease ABC subunit B